MSQSQAATRAIAAVGIDWADHWRQRVEARRVQAQTLGGLEERTDPHARYADRLAYVAPPEDPVVVALSDLLRGGQTLLDVGAGAGRYALALGPLATRITAVEPSPAMRGLLQQAIAARGVENITVVPEPWPQAAADTHDVVLCSHAMYSSADIVPFVQKLDDCARRACCLAIRVDQRVAPFVPLFREIWGHEWAPEPGFLDLYPVLFAMGIRAHARLTPFQSGPGYTDLEGAVEEARRQIGLGRDDHQHDERIRSFLSTALDRRGDRFVFSLERQSAIVWWEKG